MNLAFIKIVLKETKIVFIYELGTDSKITI